MSRDLDQLLSETLTGMRDRHVAEHRLTDAALREGIVTRAGRRRATKRVRVMLAGTVMAAGLFAFPTVFRDGGVTSRSSDSLSGSLIVPAGAPSESANHDHTFSQARIERENRETREYVACMRERGWPLPEPTPWEGAEHPGLLDPPLTDPGAADQYYLDSDECGLRYYDEDDNLLP
ncbi:MAG TPA: hypothetical protein VHN37_14100 [Actinomycetota bacterium]|nr:hypothetical protein [Actinomycetota bacterium]